MLYEADLVEPLVSTLCAVSEPMPASPAPPLFIAASFRSEPLERHFLTLATEMFDVLDVAPSSTVWPALRKEMIR